MRLVSPLLKHAVYPALHHIGLLDRITPLGDCAFVNYHGLIPSDHSGGDIFLDGNLLQPDVFRKQLQFLKARYNLIHPEDFRASIEQARPLPPRPALVTCDDGLLNSLTDMLPVLQSEGVSCLFFVTAASCGANPGMLWYEELYELMRIQPLSESYSHLPLEEGAEPPPSASFQARWWSTIRRASRLDLESRADWMAQVRAHCPHLPDFPSERRWHLLTASGLKQLADAGMTIGAHTLSHPVLSLCSEQESRREIQQSKQDLERILGQPVWAFAYPFGNPSTMGEREMRLAREAGFACAFLNVEHWGNGNSSGYERSDLFALPRTHVTSNTTLPEFAAHLSGLHTRLQRAVGG
jgi:peptidoglycan/xylan/chitin deacetylase (PgdA/CDA1 family)